MQEVPSRATASRSTCFACATSASVDSVLHRIDRELPRVSRPVSTETGAAAGGPAVELLSVSSRSILGCGQPRCRLCCSLATLVTVSVNERLGEIVVLRAIGVARHRIVQQILVEGTAIIGRGYRSDWRSGWEPLNISTPSSRRSQDFPSINFFLFQPSSAWTALGLLVTGG